jgi:hypothetical protein
MFTPAPPKLLTCKHCGHNRGIIRHSQWDSTIQNGPFRDHDDLRDHVKLAHPDVIKERAAKSRATRQRNEQAANDEAAQRKARQQAASKPVVEAMYPPSHITDTANTPYALTQSYSLELTYQGSVRTSRYPNSGAVTRIHACMAAIESAKASLARELQNAWETGTPVPQEDIDAANAAGESE